MSVKFATQNDFDRMARAVRALESLVRNNTAKPNPFNSISGQGLTISWGTLVSPWAAGNSQVTLTPCKGPLDSTATGAANVSVYVQIPCGTAAQYLGCNTGDILGYFSTSGVNVLLQVPLPRMTAKYQGWYNNAGATVNVVADFLRAHS